MTKYSDIPNQIENQNNKPYAGDTKLKSCNMNCIKMLINHYNKNLNLIISFNHRITLRQNHEITMYHRIKN